MAYKELGNRLGARSIRTGTIRPVEAAPQVTTWSDPRVRGKFTVAPTRGEAAAGRSLATVYGGRARALNGHLGVGPSPGAAAEALERAIAEDQADAAEPRPSHFASGGYAQHVTTARDHAASRRKKRG